jgi:hypothetical protein
MQDSRFNQFLQNLRELDRRFIVLLFLVVSSTFLIQSFWIQGYSLNVPIWDEWGGEGFLSFIPEILIDASHGKFNPTLYFSQNNEHRILVIRVLYVLFYFLFGRWEPWSLMLLSAALVACMAGIFFYLLKRYKLHYALILPIIFFLTAPFQWQNMVWGFGLVYYIFMLATLIGCFYIAVHRTITWKEIFLLVLLCLIEAYTLASALATWAVFGLFLLIRSYFEERSILRVIQLYWLKMLVFAGTWGITTYVYMYGFTNIGSPQKNITRIMLWVLVHLAYPIVDRVEPNSPIVLILSAIIMWLPAALVLFVLWRRSIAQPADATAQQLFLLLGGVTVFTIGNELIVAVGRADIELMVAWRYGSVFVWNAIINLLSLVILLAYVWQPRYRWHVLASLFWFTIIFAGSIHLSMIGFDNMNYRYLYYQESARNITNYMYDKSPERTLKGSITSFFRDDLMKKLDNPEFLAVLPPNLALNVPPGEWERTGDAWYPNGWYGIDPTHRRLSWGSWSLSSKLTGEIRSPIIHNESSFWIFPITGEIYKNSDTSLRIEVVGDPSRTITYQGVSPGSYWRDWYVYVGHLKGKDLQIVAIDEGNRWLGFAWPVQLSWRSFLLHAYINGFYYVLGAFIALCFLAWLGYYLWPKSVAQPEPVTESSKAIDGLQSAQST